MTTTFGTDNINHSFNQLFTVFLDFIKDSVKFGNLIDAIGFQLIVICIKTNFNRFLSMLVVHYAIPPH